MAVSENCTVSEPEKVVFVRPLEGLIVLSVGKRHEIECIAEGRPEPQYVWLKDNNIIDENDGDMLHDNSTRYLLLFVVKMQKKHAFVCCST